MVDKKIADLTHDTSLDGSEKVPLSPDGYATLAEIAALASTPAGMPIVRKFSFAYNSSNILTGHTIYTPTVGDVLITAWLEVVSAWNGTTPKGDVGQLVDDETAGWFVYTTTAVRMDLADTSDGSTMPQGLLAQSSTATEPSVVMSALADAPRKAPVKFATADPVKVWVTQDGSSTGSDPGSTQGSAAVYLVTATPV